MPPLPLVIRYVRKGGLFKIGSEELLQSGASDEQLDLIRTLENLQTPYPVLYRVLASWGMADGLCNPQDAEREWWSSLQQSMNGPGSDYVPGETFSPKRLSFGCHGAGASPGRVRCESRRSTPFPTGCPSVDSSSASSNERKYCAHDSVTSVVYIATD